ncbi:hypothetical protein [Cellulomonas taurus]|uniref:hypothetical protein n=1 Tax=Cellulomonas taurus TaxID=2729175 RepID=UPI00145EB7AB|nr:hypothetical protein [Cellulomonas taurus]
MDKKFRPVRVPIVLDPDVEEEYLKARTELEQTAEQLLSTASSRIRQARELAGDDEDARTAAGQAVVDEDTAQIARLTEAVAAADLALKDVTRQFMFRPLGRKAWKALVAANPPTEESHAVWAAEGNEGTAPWDEDGMARDLIAAACVSPKMTRDEVEHLFDDGDYSQGEIGLLWLGALQAQQTAGAI